MSRIAVKVHEAGQHTMVVMCDEELLGREVDHGKLKIRFSSEFFKGMLLDSESPELESILGRADSIIAFGRACVTRLARLFPSVGEAAIEVGGIPYVQIFKVLYA